MTMGHCLNQAVRASSRPSTSLRLQHPSTWLPVTRAGKTGSTAKPMFCRAFLAVFSPLGMPARPLGSHARRRLRLERGRLRRVIPSPENFPKRTCAGWVDIAAEPHYKPPRPRTCSEVTPR